MSDIFVPDFIEETSRGIFARHASRATLPVLTAPTTTLRPAASNRVRQHIVVVACANLKDSAFAFDSSFVDRSMATGFESLSKLVTLYPGSPMTLFGHTDPEGPAGGADLYNKFLGERRARAVYAVLLRRPEIWEQLFSDAGERQHVLGDNWGLRSVQHMLDALEFSPGNLDGKPDAQTDSALADFVERQTGTRPARGRNDAPTRALLFRAYMDFLTPIDPEDPTRTRKWQLPPDRFLNGAVGKVSGPGDFQSCSAFNPQLVLARAELDALAKEGDIGRASRHGLHEPNRRVVIYLFAPGTIMPDRWPCPSAKEGIARCKERFWSDGEQRRSTHFPEHRRRFGRSVPESRAVLAPPNPALAARMRRVETTFGCRFYHGFAVGSPCERDLKMWIIRLLGGGNKRPLGNLRYVARIGTDDSAPVIRGRTTASGTLGLPVYDDVATITLRIDAFRILFGTPPVPPKRDAPPPPPPPPPAPVAGSTDPDAFPDESEFMELTLDAGSLARIRLPEGAELPPTPGDPAPSADFDSVDAPPLTPEEQARGAGQRLRNLGFGGAELETDPVARREAIATFQRAFRQPAAVTGDLDTETIDRLAATYGDANLTQSPPT